MIDQAPLERMTPEEVLAVTFPEKEFGYDKQRVDSFVDAVAKELRQLDREIATANEKVIKPHLGTGREIGDLLQRAHDLATRIKEDAEREATHVRQQAQSAVARAKKEKDDLLRSARREAEALVGDARVEAQHASQAASSLQRLAEAKATVLQREAYEKAKQIRAEALRAADKVIAAARSQGAGEANQLEGRIRRLRETESNLRARIQSLAAHLRGLQEQTDFARSDDHGASAPFFEGAES
jgi:peptidoglycan DL-endopeptidase RipA